MKENTKFFIRSYSSAANIYIIKKKQLRKIIILMIDKNLLFLSGFLIFVLIVKTHANKNKNYNKIKLTKDANLIETFSTHDSKKYYVMPTSNSTNAANLISDLVRSLQHIIVYIEQMDKSHIDTSLRDCIRLLLDKHPHGKYLNIHELNPNDTQAIAFNRNKSEHIFICLRRDPPNEQLAELDTVLFISLHELAHSMQLGYAETEDGQTVHDREFRQCEQFLFDVARHLNMLIPENIPSRTHCGQTMPNPNTAI